MARRHTVAAVAFDGLAPFELAVACEVFGIDRSDLGVPWYRFFVCSVEDRPVLGPDGVEGGSTQSLCRRLLDSTAVRNGEASR